MKTRVRIPCVGEIVLVGTSEQYNGSNEHPAIVNRVWNDNCVNVTVLPDCGQPLSMTSVTRSTDATSSAPISQFRFPETNTWKAYDDGREDQPA